LVHTKNMLYIQCLLKQALQAIIWQTLNITFLSKEKCDYSIFVLICYQHITFFVLICYQHITFFVLICYQHITFFVLICYQHITFNVWVFVWNECFICTCSHHNTHNVGLPWHHSWLPITSLSNTYDIKVIVPIVPILIK
jgi:hypothetical protein